MTEYWFMFPLSLVIASLATGSGFGGGILLFPVFVHFLGLTIPEAVGTGMVTELCGMTSAMVSYTRQKQVEFEIAFPLIIISFPGLVTGLYIVQVVNPVYPKLFFGVVVILCALWMLFSLTEKTINTNSNLGVEEIIPFCWVPFLGGISSGVTSIGTAETLMPVLERLLKIEIHRAIATTVVVEGAVGWLATSINIWEGQIRWDVALYTMAGVILGGKIGPGLSKMISHRFLKLVFSFFVILAGLQMVLLNISEFLG